jgi:hypothetical protein
MMFVVWKQYEDNTTFLPVHRHEAVIEISKYTRL